MQIVETFNEGLKRGYTVTIPAKDIAARVDGEIKKMAPRIRMHGFRPGKVPANLVRKMHGPALHQEALNTSIRQAMDNLLRDQKLRPAMQPHVKLGDDYAEGQDAELTVNVEVLPEITELKLEGLTLEKLVVPVSDSEVDEAIGRLAEGQKRFTDAEEGRKAEQGDQLILDFVGKVDGEPFEGGSAEDLPLEIGGGRFIPGFEEQLEGATAGEQRQVEVTFPEDYPAEHLAGKAATFDVTVKAVKVPGEAPLDDEFAKNLGLESMEQLRNLLRGQVEQENAGATRTQMKRALLDQLAAGHDFPVPPSMVEAEFQQIWNQLEQEAAKEADPDKAKAEIESERDEYRAIAERRVRLGLLLSEIGQANNVQVTQQEMEMLIRQAAQQYRESDRERFVQYIRSDALAAAQLRAPLYEDKVVDFLFGKAEVTEREVTREELQSAIEADQESALSAGHVHGPDCDHDHDHGHGHRHGQASETEQQGEAAEEKAPKPAKKAAGKAKSSDEGEAAKPAKEPAEAADEPAEAKPKKPASKKAAADSAEGEAKPAAKAKSGAKSEKAKPKAGAAADDEAGESGKAGDSDKGKRKAAKA